jgi:hypothetical protein
LLFKDWIGAADADRGTICTSIWKTWRGCVKVSFGPKPKKLNKEKSIQECLRMKNLIKHLPGQERVVNTLDKIIFSLNLWRRKNIIIK